MTVWTKKCCSHLLPEGNFEMPLGASRMQHRSICWRCGGPRTSLMTSSSQTSSRHLTTFDASTRSSTQPSASSAYPLKNYSALWAVILLRLTPLDHGHQEDEASSQQEGSHESYQLHGCPKQIHQPTWQQRLTFLQTLKEDGQVWMEWWLLHAILELERFLNNSPS